MSRDFRRSSKEAPTEMLLARRRKSRHLNEPELEAATEQESEFFDDVFIDDDASSCRSETLYEELDKFPEQETSLETGHTYRWKVPYKTLGTVLILGLLALSAFVLFQPNKQTDFSAASGQPISLEPDNPSSSSEFEQPEKLTPENPRQLPDMQVHVAGAVNKPGLYQVRSSDRLGDAINAAGGAASDADLNRVNLAQPVADGLQILVPRVGEELSAEAQTLYSSAATNTGVDSSRAESAGTPIASNSPPTALININTASLEDLQELPRVGPKLAQKIIDYRENNGSYTSVADLDNVAGIGPAMLEKISPLVTF